MAFSISDFDPEDVAEQPGDGPPRLEGWDYDAWGKDSTGRVCHQLYGVWWPAKRDKRESLYIDLAYIHLECFRESRSPEDGGLGRYGHFREAVDCLWNSKRDKRGELIQQVEWNPWMEEMLEEACYNKFLSIAGCSSSSKSFGGAVWGIVNFLAYPQSAVLVTSTSIQAAKKRIWKSVIELWNGLPDAYKAKGRVRPSLNDIVYIPPNYPKEALNSAYSIGLVAAEPKQEAGAMAKLVGVKAKRLLLVADELAELSPSIVSVTSNLVSNYEFQMIAMSNPKDRDDPFGDLSKPEAGWDSIDEKTFKWDTTRGKAIRFDCLQSPNYIHKSRLYHYMLAHDVIEKERQLLGETSARFYRFFRGFFPVQGVEDVLYTETDFVAFCKETPEWGKDAPVKVAAVDWSFSSGGDLTIVMIGLFGRDKNGVQCLQYVQHYSINENAADKITPRQDQICQQIAEIVRQEGVSHRNVAVDSTGGGRGYRDRLTQSPFLSRDILSVEFGGKPSDLPVSANDRKEAYKKYSYRVDELWGVGIEFLRGSQFFGLMKCPDIVSEMRSRRYTTVKGADGEKIRMESKTDMKQRIGRSPDKSDAWMILVDLCRQRHTFRSVERNAHLLPKTDFYQKLREMDVVTQSTGGFDWEPTWT